MSDIDPSEAFRRFQAAKATPLIDRRGHAPIQCERCGRDAVVPVLSAHGRLCFDCAEAAFEGDDDGPS